MSYCSCKFAASKTFPQQATFFVQLGLRSGFKSVLRLGRRSCLGSVLRCDLRSDIPCFTGTPTRSPKWNDTATETRCKCQIQCKCPLQLRVQPRPSILTSFHVHPPLSSVKSATCWYTFLWYPFPGALNQPLPFHSFTIKYFPLIWDESSLTLSLLSSIFILPFHYKLLKETFYSQQPIQHGFLRETIVPPFAAGQFFQRVSQYHKFSSK